MSMDWDLIPFAGDKSVRKRIKELDKNLISVMVLIGIGFSKVFEGLMAIPMRNYPVVLFGYDLTPVFWWSLYVGFWVIIYLLEVDTAAKEAVTNLSEGRK